MPYRRIVRVPGLGPVRCEVRLLKRGGLHHVCTSPCRDSSTQANVIYDIPVRGTRARRGRCRGAAAVHPHPVMTTAPVHRFDGMVALVVGGGAGIGRAACARLAAEGARVWILDRDDGADPEAATDMPQVEHRSVDFSDATLTHAVIGDVAASTGRIDVLVNAVEIPAVAHSVGSMSTWTRAMALVDEVRNSCAAVLPVMSARRRGAIVNLASDAGLVGWPGYGLFEVERAADGDPDIGLAAHR